MTERIVKKGLCRGLLRLAGAGLLLLGMILPAAAHFPPEQGWPPACTIEQLDGQLVLICLPREWSGLLVVYAHGFVAPQAPLELPTAELDGLILSGEDNLLQTLLDQGVAFATTSYSKNGYAVEQAGTDLDRLLERVRELAAPEQAAATLIVGASEGGLIAVQQLEQHPNTYQGGLALCAPLGGTAVQVDYLLDFRAAFDFYFPDVFDFGPVEVPAEAYMDWAEHKQAIQEALQADPQAAALLFRDSGAAWDRLDPADSRVSSASEILYHNVWGSEDLIETAGGVPYDNTRRVYRGDLEEGIERVAADPAARAYLEQFYRPSGALQRPLVTLHTTQDPVVPYQHVTIYSLRATRAQRGPLLTSLRVPRYGHCSLTREEVLGAFALLLGQVTGSVPPGLEQYLPLSGG